ncbi:MAG: hypothetical protein OHK0011_19560 [Turneriella sp.]
MPAPRASVRLWHLPAKGLAVTVLEKEAEIGIHRRGETIRFHQGMENLLYPGFFAEQTIHKINQRTYYSHTGKKTADRQISTWNLKFGIPRGCFFRQSPSPRRWIRSGLACSFLFAKEVLQSPKLGAQRL